MLLDTIETIDTIDAPDKEDAPTTEIAALPPADRAALVLNSAKTEADLKQLATSLKAVTTVNSPAGREQAHALAMTARTARTTIEKAGKAARDDATKFSRAVIAEEDRLIEIIQPEETRVLGLRNAWDAAEAARKEAEAQKERERIAAHQAVVTQIKSYPGLARECRTAFMASTLITKLTDIDVSGLEEFAEAAQAAMNEARDSMVKIVDQKIAAEAEQARIKAEQEAEAARLAEQARIQAEQQAELLAMQARMKAQQEELDRQAAAMAKQAAELEARKAQAAKPAVLLADDAREALAQIMPSGLNITVIHQPDPVIVQQPATVDQMHGIGNGIMYGTTTKTTPTAMGLVANIANNFSVEKSTALRWLAERADEFKTMNTITEVTP